MEITVKKLSTSRFPAECIVIAKSKERFEQCRLQWSGKRYEIKECSRDWPAEILLSSWEAFRVKETCTYVFGFRIYEMICAANFKESIDSGTYALTIGNSDNSEDEKDWKIGKQLGVFVAENPPTIIDITHHQGHKFRIVDLCNYGMELADFEDELDTSDLDKSVQAIQDYCELLAATNMGGLKTTAASQAWACYRTNHYDDKIVAHDNHEVRKHERRAYAGGRCEVFRLGKIPDRCYYLDVKGMYNAIALNGYFPSRMYDYQCSVTGGIELTWPHLGSTIADVEIDTPIPIYPCKLDGITVYPVGRFRAVLAGPELMLACSNSHVRKCFFASKYEMKPLFTRFASWYFDTLNRLESLGLSHLKPALKLACNSMYGKIGSRGKSWKTVSNPDYRPRWARWHGSVPGTRELTQWQSIDGVVQWLDCDGEPPVSCPAIPAFMNSYGRCQLLNIMYAIGFENVHYVDTDGLIVNEEGYHSAVNSGMVAINVPGMLTIRGSSTDTEIFALKHYRFDGKITCAGIPVDRVFDRIDETMILSHEQFGYALWHRNPFYPKYVEEIKKHAAHYRHGVRNNDGSVAALLFAEWSTVDPPCGGLLHDPRGYACVGSVDRERARKDPVQYGNGIVS
jgi:DNA polymerase type B, organellar and viral